MIKLNFKILYPLNLYVYIENASKWHPFAHKVEDKFTKKQLNLLKKYLKIRKKYEDKRWFEDSFTKENLANSLNFLKRKLPSKEFKTIKNIFYEFDSYYQRVWKKREKTLKKIARKSGKKSEKILQGKIKNLKKILNTPNLKKVNVYLSYCKNGLYGSVFGKSGILIEISKANFKEMVFIILHELIHYADINYGKNSLRLLKNDLGEKRAFVVHEAITMLLTQYLLKGFYRVELSSNSEWLRKVKKI